MLQNIFFILLASRIEELTAAVGFANNDLNQHFLSLVNLENGFFSKLLKDLIYEEDIVRLDLYYEVFCPHCVNFDKHEFGPLVDDMREYLDIHTYPYGNAKMFKKNGTIYIKCQHGPTECYGNKLHACALDILQHPEALLFNICMMNTTKGLGSDDKTADECGKKMIIDSEPIKVCAKSKRGTELLIYYGEESKKANFHHVPYVLINGRKFNIGDDLKKEVCAAFENPPPPCTNE